MSKRLVPLARAARVLIALCATAVSQAAEPGPQAGPPGSGRVQIPVLRMASGARNWQGDSTIWRYHETWQTDVARTDAGKLVRVDPLRPRADYSSTDLWRNRTDGATGATYRIAEAAEIAGSDFPPDAWRQPDFDDSAWVRTAVPMGCHYRSLALVCLRGKFEVSDPAQVDELSLETVFQGGAVFYINGREIGRSGLPAGKLEPDTPADDYPLEAFLHPNGSMLLPQVNNSLWIMGEAEQAKAVTDPRLQERYKLRFRRSTVRVPGSQLRPGVNVLAVEVHRAPAREAMFTTVSVKEMGYNLPDHRNWWWNRASIESLTLTATAGAGAIVGRVSRPAGIQAWNWPLWERVDQRLYGDPAETLQPIRLAGAKNGAFSGQIVVSSSDPITGLTAQVSMLQGPAGASLPKPNVSLRYGGFYNGVFDPLESFPPDPADRLPGRTRSEPAMVPVWLSVEVPRTAAAGDYSGTLTLSAQGLPSRTVPVQLHLSNYVLPDPRDFTTYLGFVQSPDTLAIRYNVPMWSEPHWKLIEESMRILGLSATKELTIPLLRKTHFGNEHAMLWWVRQRDGSLRPDLEVVRRYVEVAVRQLGRIPTVILYVSEGEEGRTIPWITEFDPDTGECRETTGPRWGTEEARAFWKPAFDGLRGILADAGLTNSLCVGYHAADGNGPVCAQECIDDLKVLEPEARWIRLGHFWSHGHDFLEKGPNGNPWARVGLVGNYGVFWDPGRDEPFYGWRNPFVVTAYTRGTFSLASPLRDYRLCAEAILLTGWRDVPAGWGITDFAGEFGRDTFLGMRGFAPWGGDYWPVLRGPSGMIDIIARFNDPSAAHWDPRSSWSTTALNNYQVTYMVCPGRDGPVSGARLEALREGLQEAEARVFVQSALLDEKLRARLGADLARRAGAICDERTRALRYLSEFRICTLAKEPWPSHYIFDSYPWQQRSARLYDLAADVAAALGVETAGRGGR